MGFGGTQSILSGWRCLWRRCDGRGVDAIANGTASWKCGCGGAVVPHADIVTVEEGANSIWLKKSTLPLPAADLPLENPDCRSSWCIFCSSSKAPANRGADYGITIELIRLNMFVQGHLDSIVLLQVVISHNANQFVAVIRIRSKVSRRHGLSEHLGVIDVLES